MNGKVSLGKTREPLIVDNDELLKMAARSSELQSSIHDGEDYFVDFAGDKIGLTLLTGTTGSGKGVLHYHMYRTLMDQNAPEELAFIFMDMTRVDFVYWRNTHLYCPVIVDREEALLMLEKLGDISAKRARGEADASQAIFVHIEECDMVAVDRERFESAFEAILQHTGSNNIHIVFSTSRPSTNVFTEKILKLADMRVVYLLASSQDYIHVTGKDMKRTLGRINGEVGEHVVITRKESKFLAPFPEEYVQEIQQEVDELVSKQSPFANAR